MTRRKKNRMPEFKPVWRWIRVLAIDPTPESGPPVWTSDLNPPLATRGVPYFFDFSFALEGDIESIEVVSGALPAGLRIEGLTIVGTPE